MCSLKLPPLCCSVANIDGLRPPAESGTSHHTCYKDDPPAEGPFPKRRVKNEMIKDETPSEEKIKSSDIH